MAKKEAGGVFENYKEHSLTKPRDLAWSNWKSWDNPKVGDQVRGFVRDAFYRPAEGQFKDQRGLTIEQEDGVLINVGIKRLPFILSQTDDLHLGDPFVMELIELKPNATKGFSPTNIFAFYSPPFDGVRGEKTVKQLDDEDRAKGGSIAPANDLDKTLDEVGADDPLK